MNWTIGRRIAGALATELALLLKQVQSPARHSATHARWSAGNSAIAVSSVSRSSVMAPLEGGFSAS